MSEIVPAAPPRRKSGRRSRADQAERALMMAKARAVASCPMMVAARRIVAQAEQLRDLLDAFERDFDRESIVADVKAVGLSVNGETYRHIADLLLYDCRGGTYLLEALIANISSEVAPEQPEEVEGE